MSGYATNGMNQVAQGTQLTGAELLALDTQITNGTQPQTYAASVDQLSLYSKVSPGGMVAFRNLLDGGDFSTSPWQRGTATPGGTITTTVTYTADRWFAFGTLANTNVNVSRQALTAGTYPGIGHVLRFGRASGATGVGTCILGQALETVRSRPAQGCYVLLSFYAQAGAGFATATGAGLSGTLGVTLVSGTGTDQASTLISPISTGWTGQTTINSVAAGVVGAVSSVSVTGTTLTRYYVLGKMPAAATQLAVLFSYAPGGTAAANEYVELADIQLEVVSNNATQANAAGYATSVEKRDVQTDLDLCQRHFFQQAEGSAGIVAGTGQSFTATTGRVFIPFPVQMRVAPTVTTTIGTFAITNAAGTGQTITTLAAVASNTSVNGASLNVTTSGTVTAGNGALLIGAAGTGAIVATADL